MTAYGSLINLISGSNPDLIPEVGMGATVLMWTDRRAATVIEVSKSGKKLTIQFDDATRTDSYGMSDAQSYSYAPNPNAATRTYTKRKNGQWVPEGEPMRGGSRLGLGYRNHYYDYSFQLKLSIWRWRGYSAPPPPTWKTKPGPRNSRKGSATSTATASDTGPGPDKQGERKSTMKSTKDTYTGKRFRYTDIVTVSIDGSDYDTVALITGSGFTWLHPSRLLPSMFKQLNPKKEGRP